MNLEKTDPGSMADVTACALQGKILVCIKEKEWSGVKLSVEDAVELAHWILREALKASIGNKERDDQILFPMSNRIPSQAYELGRFDERIACGCAKCTKRNALLRG